MAIAKIQGIIKPCVCKKEYVLEIEQFLNVYDYVTELCPG